MPIDTVTVGSNDRQIQVVGDPSTASRMQSVVAPGDALSIAGLYASLVASVKQLLNDGGTYDLQRSAVGTTGIPAVNFEGTKKSYSACVTGFTPAANPTDFWQIIGSATKLVRVTRIVVTGIATAATGVVTQLIKRTTADTGGAPAAADIMKHDSNDAAPTAVVNAFTANPAPLGASAYAGRTEYLNLGLTGASIAMIWDFGTRNTESLVLRGVAQSLNLNWGGVAVPAGTKMEIYVEWTEE